MLYIGERIQNINQTTIAGHKTLLTIYIVAVVIEDTYVCTLIQSQTGFTLKPLAKHLLHNLTFKNTLASRPPS